MTPQKLPMLRWHTQITHRIAPMPRAMQRRGSRSDRRVHLVMWEQVTDAFVDLTSRVDLEALELYWWDGCWEEMD